MAEDGGLFGTKEKNRMSEQSLSEIADVVETQKPRNMFDKIVVGGFSIVLAVNALLLTLVVCGAASARYLFKINFYGYDEIVILLAFWFYFIGAAYGSYNNTHVTADVVDAYFPDGSTKRALTFIRQLITASICGVFTYFAFNFFLFGFVGPLGNFTFQPKTMVWRIPLWISYSSVFVGLFFMEIYFLRNLVLGAKALIAGGRGDVK
jgi:TRAP-type C4-dicarboxylate transport system permease small subunit